MKRPEAAALSGKPSTPRISVQPAPTPDPKNVQEHEG